VHERIPAHHAVLGQGQKKLLDEGNLCPLTSTICLTCGFVELVGDPEAARAAIEKSTAVR